MNPQHYATYNAQPPPQQQHYGRTGSAAFGAQFATAGRTASMSSGGMMPPPLNAWSPPSPQEHQYYDLLFSMADEEKRNAIGGRIAVAFFSRSGVDKMHLREIWTIADSQQRSELSRNEFYVAMRLISMAQRGEAVSAQRFYELAATPFPLPNIEGVPPPVQQMQMQQQLPQQSMAAPVASPQGSYAITDEEKQRYDGIFQQYDTDHDGFLHGGEAVQLFGMSGLDRGVLREIWSLADRGQDSRLDVKEFYIAMHMIVCVSKRGLPLPKELPTEMAESVFGPSRSSFTSPSADPLASLGGLSSMGGSGSSRSNSMAMPPPVVPTQPHQPSPVVAPTPSVPQASQDPMDAFASLSPVIETTQASRTSSFGRTNSGSSQVGSHSSLPSMTLPAPQSSLDSAMASLGVGAPSPAASTTGSFSGVSVNGGLGLSSLAHGSSSQFGLGTQTEPPRDRAGSVGSVSSFTSVSTEASISHGMAGSFSQAPPSVPLGHPNTGSFHGMAVPPQMPPIHSAGMSAMYAQGGMAAAPAPKPFLSDEGEAAAVRQLEQSNEALVQTLQGVEKKQHAIELLSDKLRELDQLRHELVTLSLKRESVRVASAPATSAPSQQAHAAADSEAIRAVEQTLRALIDGENALIQSLRADITQYERELEQGGLGNALPSVGAGFGTAASPAASAALGGSTTLQSQLPSGVLSDATPKNTFEAFDGFGSSSPAPEAFAASDAFANFNFS